MLFAAMPFVYCAFIYVPNDSALYTLYCQFSKADYAQIFATFIQTYNFFFIIHNLLYKTDVVNDVCLCVVFVLLNRVVFIMHNLFF